MNYKKLYERQYGEKKLLNIPQRQFWELRKLLKRYDWDRYTVAEQLVEPGKRVLDMGGELSTDEEIYHQLFTGSGGEGQVEDAEKYGETLRLLYLPEYPFFHRLSKINQDQRPWDSYTYFIHVAGEYAIKTAVISMESNLLLHLPGHLSYSARRLLQAIKALCTLHSYDIVLAWRGPSIPLLLVRRILRWRSPKVIVITWRAFSTKTTGLKRYFKKLLAKITFSMADRIVVVSSIQKELFQNALGVPSEKITFIPYGVDCEFFVPSETGSGQSFLLTTGNVERDDDLLIQIVEDMGLRLKRVTSFSSVVTHINNWIETNSLKDVEVYQGISYRKLCTLLNECTFVVLPMLPADHPAGLTALLEAMAAGKAVIITKGLSTLDYIKDGETGVLVEPRDLDALKESIRRLLVNVEERKQIALAARRAVEEKFCVQMVADTLAHVIWGLL